MSRVWLHGARLGWRYEGSTREMWLCKLCHERGHHHTGLLVVNGYTAIFNHLGSVHNVVYDEKKERVDSSSLHQPGLLFAKASSATLCPARSNIDVQGLLQAHIDWAIKQDITYRQATSQDTRDLLSFDHHELDTVLWKSHNSLKEAVEKAYHLRFSDIHNLLQRARSKIHISCDVWTSTNGLSLLGVVAHFVG